MKVLIIGAGENSVSYVKVLNDMDIEYSVTCRSATTAASFSQKILNAHILYGIEAENLSFSAYTHVIISVNVEFLAEIAIRVIKAGVKNILLEKPGGINSIEIAAVADLARTMVANVYVAYNRRFFQSVNLLEQLIEKDNGLLSMNFEFTEWYYDVYAEEKYKCVYDNILYCNSSHVIDLAFFVAGVPVEMSSFVNGEPGKPFTNVFAGSGKTKENVLFTYKANWKSKGRWSMEFLTSENRFMLGPMERLFIYDNSLNKYEMAAFDYSLDEKYKPGFYNQVKAFLFEENSDNLLTIQTQLYNADHILNKIGGYGNV
jgi:predicted dehydrogenase